MILASSGKTDARVFTSQFRRVGQASEGRSPLVRAVLSHAFKYSALPFGAHHLAAIHCCTIWQASIYKCLDDGNVFTSIDLVVSLFRNYASQTATWIRIITLPARNEVNMAVHYRLTSSRAAIDPYVETQHGRVLLQDEISGFGEQLLAGAHFRRIQGQNSPHYAASG